MARLRYFGERNEAAPYLTDRGWTLNGRSLRDLLAADNLPPLEDDDLRMGDVLYVSGTLISSKHRKQTVSIDSALVRADQGRSW